MSIILYLLLSAANTIPPILTVLCKPSAVKRKGRRAEDWTKEEGEGEEGEEEAGNIS